MEFEIVSEVGPLQQWQICNRVIMPPLIQCIQRKIEPKQIDVVIADNA